MKYKLLYLPLICASLLTTTSCNVHVLKGEGKIITNTTSPGTFTGIEIDVPMKVEITVNPNAPTSLELSSYENMIGHLKSKVEGNLLHITTDLDGTWTIFNNTEITAKINLNSLNQLSLQGAQDANVHGNITGSVFKLEVSGAGKVIIDSVNTDTLSSELSGAADITINGGQVKSANYSISGAGKIKSFPLQAQSVSAALSGATKMELTALSKLNVSISGASNIKYKGHPSITQDISGVGSIEEAK